MADLVERLRGWAFRSDQMTSDGMYNLTKEAADEIERLRAAHKEAYELAYGVARHDCEAEIERLRHRCRELDFALTELLEEKTHEPG